MEEVLSPGQFLVRASPRHVEAWSVKRLPFEPTGWLADLRNCIRESVLKMSCDSSELLEGLYGSQDQAYCDTENILFYNIGTSYFRGLTRAGLRFERSFAEPPQAPRDLGYAPAHYVRYRAVPVHGPFLPARRTLATCQTELVSFDLMHVWLSVKRADGFAKARSKAHLGPFGLAIVIDVPSTHSRDAASVVKPVLDGLVSALHFHDGSMLDEVVGRIARLLGAGEAEIAGHLMKTETAALGERRLVWPRGRSVQWNPGDDCCVAGEVLMSPSNDCERPRLTAELFAV